MEDINKEDINTIKSLSKSQEIRFYIAFIFVLLGFLCTLSDVYLSTADIISHPSTRIFFLSPVFTLLGLILMHGLRAELKKKKIMLFRKESFFICLLGYLSILILSTPFFFIVKFIYELSAHGLSGLN